ncbi:XTP/dITP diphosphatase [Neobittarella massiliensis]|uniref:XTP/dITP diphosphatase n=1 Tax=Neobittarella massiliensis (ex Bilen et al. 2018) TaxID=2041842 RepID=UPI000CF6113A|nr:XTP/dITP diphosphatase [Neobittarella massiliensis]
MRFIIATNNQKKLKEFRRILDSYGIEAVSLKEAGIETEIEETGTTFEENSFIKAKAICDLSGQPAIADDSGLAVDALGGAPGVYSARYSGEGATDEKNNQKLLAALEGVPAEERGAKFVSVITCVFPDGRSFHTRGECPGVIGLAPKGDSGFGYDPLFYVGEDKTFASIGPDEKDAISHRGKALADFAPLLQQYLKER